jgi:hypothetical protein
MSDAELLRGYFSVDGRAYAFLHGVPYTKEEVDKQNDAQLERLIEIREAARVSG